MTRNSRVERIWLNNYPNGVPAEVDTSAYASLVDLLDESFQKHAVLPAYKYMGKSFSFSQIDVLSRAFAAYLQASGLKPGDRVAVMMPNVPQYPVVVLGILRAGMVVVNVNPLYTPRELEHQLKDAGTASIVIMENFAATLQAAQAHAKVVDHVVLTTMGDMLGWIKGAVVNHVVRKIKKMVPEFQLADATRFNDAIAAGRSSPFRPVEIRPDDLAVLQYTGGTTGISKGAMLLHRNLVANILQSQAWYRPALNRVASEGQVVTICALPLYHIFGFNTNMMLGLCMGGCGILIPNPRDISGTLKTLSSEIFHSFPAVNTLFHALLHHPDFNKVDWSHLKLSVGGGMAVQQKTAQLWFEKTGCVICQGYGLSETSPVVTCNPTDSSAYSASIGLPVPGTEIRLLDDAGHEVPKGQAGEIAVRGPQVMAGYWKRPEETAQIMTPDGFFRTGDIGLVDPSGAFSIVDRKKDMILVSGFNVYPNEVEDVITQMPGVLECAAIGIPDEKAGEAVMALVVKKDPAITETDIRHWCEAYLTGYKRPKRIEFRNDLPKTAVGKILRRQLRALNP